MSPLDLKTATAAHHQATERHPLQQKLLTGQLPRTTYAAWLGQLLLSHRELEWHLARLRFPVGRIGDVVSDHQLHVPALERDLAFLGVDVEALAPLSATAALISDIDRTAVRARLALLGFQYVLEGSKNGGRHIAKRVRLAYRLPVDRGATYLDPYGTAQEARWREFKTSLRAAALAPQEMAVLAAAAREMFAHLAAIMDDVLAAS